MKNINTNMTDGGTSKRGYSSTTARRKWTQAMATAYGTGMPVANATGYAEPRKSPYARTTTEQRNLKVRAQNYGREIKKANDDMERRKNTKDPYKATGAKYWNNAR